MPLVESISTADLTCSRKLSQLELGTSRRERLRDF
jgi:hypothetical protein